MNVMMGYIFTYLYVFFILISIEFLSKKINLINKISRKLVHILVSFTYIIMVYFFSNTYHLLIPPITFIVINYISYKKEIFKAMEMGEKSLGTVYYPISMLVMAIFSVYNAKFIPLYGIGLFSMAFGDGLASIVGKKFKSMSFKMIGSNKTLLGSSMVFVFTLLVTIIFNYKFNLSFEVLEIFIIALIATILELFSKKGFDNILLPIGVFLISFIFI